MRILERIFRPRASADEELLRRMLAADGPRVSSGVHVTPDSAMRVAAVYACVRVLAEDVAKLPLILYRRLPGGGKERASDHPLYGLLHDRPNPWQTSFEWREMLQGHLGLRGNAYAYVHRVGSRPAELLPIHPDRVTPKQDGRLNVTYKVDGYGDNLGRDRILHLRGLSSDGLRGLAPIELAREAVGLAVATEQHGARLFANGAKPGAVAEHPGKLTKEAATRLKESLEAATSGANVHRLLLLEEGMKWQQVGLNNEDSQFLETRKFQVEEVARWYRMPLHKIQSLDRATNNNIEHQALEYVTDTLLPWLARWEQRLNADLLGHDERKTYFFEFLVDGLLRGDIKSRFEAYASAINAGWMSRNEARIRENLNPAGGLDEFLSPLNMQQASAPAPDA